MFLIENVSHWTRFISCYQIVLLVNNKGRCYRDMTTQLFYMESQIFSDVT